MKFKAESDKQPGIYLRQEAPAQPIRGEGLLEAFNQNHSVLSAVPFFRKTFVQDLRESQAVFLKEMEEVKRRFPKRTARIPEDAVVPDVGNTYLLEMPMVIQASAAVNALSQNPFVEYAEVPVEIEFAWVPNDYYWNSNRRSWGQAYEDLWGLKKINVQQAWDISKGANVVLAVVDSGLDDTHPDWDQTNNGWVNESERGGNDANCYNGVDNDGNGKIDDCYGWDFNDNDNDPMDTYGHGTHVTGIMGAAGNNVIGTIGIAHMAKFMPLKTIHPTTSAYLAIDYAVVEGADIINCSWRSLAYSQTLSDAIANAYSAGVAVVSAAGNFFQEVPTDQLPAAHNDAITVGASTTTDMKANFSNYGKFVDLVAPGGNDDNGNGDNNPWQNPADNDRHNILSLRSATTVYPSPWLDVDTDYYRMGGTSMSTAYVTGVAALILSADSNNLSLTNIYDVLRVSVDDITVYGKGVDDMTGFGRLNSYKAVTNRCLTPYADVPAGYWAKTQIKKVTCREITTGCTSSNFCPENNITERSAANFVIKSKYTADFNYPTTPYFTDVPSTDSDFKVIQKMKADGINAGCGGGNYCPNNPVARAGAAAYIIRAIYGENFQYTVSPPYFTDVPQSHWAYKYIQKMADKNVANSCNAGQFCPESIATRAEMAYFTAKAPFQIWRKGRTDPN